VLQPERIRHAGLEDNAFLREAEATVVVAYGQVLPAELCDQPERPALNVHYSLLPEFRGPAPVQAALLAGKEQTGVTIQHVALQLDTGDLVRQQATAIESEDNAGTLFARLEQIGVPLLLETLRLHEAGETPRFQQQEDRASYAPLPSAAQIAIDWRDPAEQIRRRIQAFSPRPGAYCYCGDVRWKIFAAQVAGADQPSAQPGEILAADAQGIAVQTGNDILCIQELQSAGGRRMGTADFLRGQQLPPGQILRNGRD
jgi:methionyl-tRNA formyltransferase